MLNEQKNAKTQIDQSLARINKIDVLYERLYEDNVSGKVTDSFYMELSHKYENEKEELKKKIFNLKIQLDELNKKVFHKEMFLSTIEKFMEMKTITAPLIRELIERIEVHETEGEGKYKTQRIVIIVSIFGDTFDFNRDGKLDMFEQAMEFSTFMQILDDTKREELEEAGLDIDELEMMSEEERYEAIEEAGLDPDDFDI